MPKRRTYTDEELREAVRLSTSRRQVLLRLGLAPEGGNYATTKRAMEHLSLGTSHFLPPAGHNKGVFLGPKRPVRDYLVDGSLIRTSRLRERLIQEGYFEHQCSRCRGRTWLGEPIPLELDHINGSNEDNRLENLRLLCPNCHAQTPTYCRRKSGSFTQLSQARPS